MLHTELHKLCLRPKISLEAHWEMHINGISSSSTPWNLSYQIWQFQAQVWHLLSNLHRSSPCYILSFCPPEYFSNPYFFCLFHFIWPCLWCPLHCSAHCHLCLCYSEHPHGHARQGCMMLCWSISEYIHEGNWMLGLTVGQHACFIL